MFVALLASCGESGQDDGNVEEFGFENTDSDMDATEDESGNNSNSNRVGNSGNTLEEKTPFRNEEIAGEWTVRMRVTNSSCAGTNVGDIKEEKWFVNFETGVLNIKIMEKGSAIKEYWGKFSGLNIEAVADKLISEQEPFAAEDTSKPINRIKLKVADKDNIMGTRFEISKNACQTTYEVVMKR